MRRVLRIYQIKVQNKRKNNPIRFLLGESEVLLYETKTHADIVAVEINIYFRTIDGDTPHRATQR